jgi:hypothetical protein
VTVDHLFDMAGACTVVHARPCRPGLENAGVLGDRFTWSYWNLSHKPVIATDARNSTELCLAFSW